MRCWLLVLALVTGCPGDKPGDGVVPPDPDVTEGDASAAVDSADTGTEPDLSEPKDVPAPADPGVAMAEVAEVAVEPVLPAPCAAGEPCDDDDPCSHSDACGPDNVCAGTSVTCSDGKGCTKDVCDGEGGCQYPVAGDRCLIDGACWFDGDISPDGCLACVVPVSRFQWTADDSASCDDGDFCTEGDHCFGGVCVVAQTLDCDDGNYCTDDLCSSAGGCLHPANERPCSDDNPCTIGDTCKGAKCLPGVVPVTCNDDNTCTLDSCEAGVGCVYANQTFKCDDGDPCTEDDICAAGHCQAGTPKPCKDDNPCTSDLCHPAAGCIFPFNQLACEDGDKCTTGDLCAYGTCHSGPLLTGCNDNNPCTQDFCDEASGQCVNAALSGPCTDGDACTLADFCELGACIPGGEVVTCDDQNDCTDDHCNAQGLCEFAANLLACDDGDPCSKGDFCKAGQCLSGLKQLNCFDANPCTDDGCISGQGCVHTPNGAPCSDGDACTLGDKCLAAQCTPGKDGAGCADGNACTDDSCLANKGCVNIPNTVVCNDNDPCTTGDHCFDGTCTGTVGDCDDDNDCTKELCLDGGGCQHIALNTPGCRPHIQIFSPPRGAMLQGPPNNVFVTGSVTIGGSSVINDFFINDKPVALDPVTGGFVLKMTPSVGLNVIRAVANGAVLHDDGTKTVVGDDTAIRSFAWSQEYFPVDQPVPQGLGLWLSQQVWDDNNTSDVDDIATVITLILEDFDLPSLIPNPLTKTKALHCDVTVTAQPIAIGNPTVDFTTKNQALHMKVRYPSLFVGLNVNLSGFLCPSISGDVSASYIQVSMDLVLNDNPAGVDMEMANEKVQIQNLDVQIGGILGFLTNWLVNFFEGTIAKMVEGLVLEQLSIVPETMAAALNALAISQEFELPSFIGEGESTTMLLTSNLTAADFDQFGGFLELSTSITAGQKKIPYQTKGSLGRAQCAENNDFFDYLMQSEMEIALKDDMLNQLLHALWYAGAFEIPLDASILGEVDLSDYGVTVTDLSISMLLPPIVSSCNFEKQLYMGLGDLKVNASLTLFGSPLTITAYASGIIKAEMVVVDDGNGPSASIGLDEIVLFDVEVDEVNAGFEGAEAAVEELMTQFLGPELLTSIGGETLGGIPIPSIPLDGFSESIPKGTALQLFLTKIYRLGGRTVLAGNVVSE